MFKRSLPVAIALIIPNLLSAQAPQMAEKTARDIYKLAGPSVVLIESYGDDGKVSGTGSGFLVSADGRILTNFHVIAHTKRATVRLANEDAYDSVSVLDVDKRKDVALLKIRAVNLPYLKMGHSASVQIGDTLYTLGNPLGILQNTFSEGLLSGVRQMDGYKLFQLSAPISLGSSGSPVLNAQGEVIGIVEGLIPEGQNLNFAVPIDYASGMLESRELQRLSDFYTPEETRRTPAPASTETATPVSPSLAMSQNSISYLGTKIGIWTKEDAEVELGKPFDRRDGLLNAVVIGDIYKFGSPNSTFSFIELNFNRTNKRLAAAYFYYSRQVPWKSVEQTLGKSYRKQKLPNGRPAYIYQFQGRQMSVIVDSANDVYSGGIW